jgi:hypothetical protein
MGKSDPARPERVHLLGRDAKQAKARQRRIERTCEELREGKKRPCCWAGCIHRTDKAPGRWQQAVLIDGKAKRGL